MSETKHKNMVVRMTTSLYATMQTFASLNNVTVSDVMRTMCEAVARKMRDAVPHQDTFTDEFLSDQGLRVTRDEPSPVPIAAPIEPPKTPSKPQLVQTPRAQPASSITPIEEPSSDALPAIAVLDRSLGRAQQASSQQPPASGTTEPTKRKALQGIRSKKDEREDADYYSR